MSISTDKLSGDVRNVKTSASLPALRIASWLAVITLVILATMHIVEPEYQPSWRFVSEYSNGKYGWLMKLGFFTMGFSFIAMFFGIRSQVNTRAGKLGLVLLICAGIGGAAAGVFDMDPINSPKEHLTWHGQMHGLTALIGIPLSPIAVLLISYALTRHTKNWSANRHYILLFAHLTWISLVVMQIILFTSLAKTNGQFGPDVPIGWPNRLVVVCYELWIIIVAGKSIKLAGKQNEVNNR
jgi:hypothetical membrane protein